MWDFMMEQHVDKSGTTAVCVCSGNNPKEKILIKFTCIFCRLDCFFKPGKGLATFNNFGYKPQLYLLPKFKY